MEKSLEKSSEFEKIVKEKYLQMLKNNQTEDVLDEEKFGKLSIFIDKKPNFSLLSFEFDAHKVWVGAETVK